MALLWHKGISLSIKAIRKNDFILFYLEDTYMCPLFLCLGSSSKSKSAVSGQPSRTRIYSHYKSWRYFNEQIVSVKNNSKAFFINNRGLPFTCYDYHKGAEKESNT